MGRAIGSGNWHQFLIESVDAAKTTKQPNAVVNLSFDLTQINPDGTQTTRHKLTAEERLALQYAKDNNILIVAAAGNEGNLLSALGQASTEFDNIITVGASQNNYRAAYSSYGGGLDILAPIDIPETTENSTSATKQGTSIAIRWGEPDSFDSKNLMMLSPNFYWSIGDQFSLLEIGFDSKIKIILVIKVVLAGRVTIQPSEFHMNTSLPAQLGLPLFQIDDELSIVESTSGYCRENGSFKLHIGSNHLCVNFSNLEVVSQIVCGRVRFGLDVNNYLCMVEVSGFSSEEIAQLTETLKYQCS